MPDLAPTRRSDTAPPELPKHSRLGQWSDMSKRCLHQQVRSPNSVMLNQYVHLNSWGLQAKAMKTLGKCISLRCLYRSIQLSMFSMGYGPRPDECLPTIGTSTVSSSSSAMMASRSTVFVWGQHFAGFGHQRDSSRAQPASKREILQGYSMKILLKLRMVQDLEATWHAYY